jgi:hypothetical protein
MAALVILGTTSSAMAEAKWASVKIEGVPHIEQKPDFCGEACAAMWLAKLGKTGDQDWVFDRSELDPSLARGDYAPELAKALTSIGFVIGKGWFSVPADDDEALNRQFTALHADLLKQIPSIVCMHSGPGPQATEHFRLILGYDARTDEVIYHEPAEARGAYRRMKRDLFLQLWPLKYQRDAWTVIRFRLESGSVVDGEVSETPTAADYAQHLMALKDKLPAHFHMEIIPPFVVIGDGAEADLHRFAQGTVTWAVEKLKADYFEKDPDEILDIYLFQNAESYQKYAKSLFGDEPDTPYGYYSPAHQALIMNIATGGGTLVHEIVHPFVRANVPNAPPWFNEGLGSLYEQSSERDGHIVGLTNWRLTGLQKALKQGLVPSIQVLTAQDSDAFYSGEHDATNYGQARYLLYYLQEHGLLADFYKRFMANRGTDPTGYRSLVQTLGERDMAVFEKKWARWVMGLRFGQ